MKQIKLLCLLCLLCCLLAAGCGGREQGRRPNVEEALQAAQTLSEAQLYSKAQQELQDTELHFYSITTTAQKVMQNFVQEYPAFKGKIYYHELDRESYYPTMMKDMAQGRSGIDFLLVHGDLLQKLRDRQLVANYFPASQRENVAPAYQDPAAFCLLNALFLYRAPAGEAAVQNVWELTESKWQDKILFKDLLEENANLNFLIMLTSPAWTEKLTQAYEQHYGHSWSGAPGDAIAYAWIAGFLNNCNLSYTSNTDIAKALAQSDAPHLALTGFNKLRKLSGAELERVKIWADAGTVQGFAGFAYGAYACVTKNTNCPYACALFINYIFSGKGFAGRGAWNDYTGYYSPNTTIKKDAGLQDHDLAYWQEKLVVEDTAYIATHKQQVTEFVLRCLSEKNLQQAQRQD